MFEVNPSGLFDDQQAAFDAIEASNDPWFITGEAGTGKSALLRHLAEFGKDADNTAILAFTGIAAVNVDGMTIHSFALQTKAFNMEINAYVPLPNSIELRKKLYPEIANTKLLIIDEVSMARADMVDALDRALRQAKNEPFKPFGGCRVVMFGDLYQLPPFLNKFKLFKREAKFLSGYFDSWEISAPYFFEAHVFSMLKIRNFNLTIPKRQKDADFIEHLNALRTSSIPLETQDYFAQFSSFNSKPGFTRLGPRRRPVQYFNEQKIAELTGDSKFYHASSNLENPNLDDLPLVNPLELKVGAFVMVTKNLDLKQKIVNGATGIVKSLAEKSVTLIMDGTDLEVVIEAAQFDIKGLVSNSENDTERNYSDDAQVASSKIKSRIVGSVWQIPIVPAYAMTVHKAQGQSLSKLTVDFQGEYFEAGQAYVALSRATSPEGLDILGALDDSHVQPYAPHLEEFLQSLSSLEPAASQGDANLKKTKAAIAKVLHWRDVNWVETILNEYLEAPRQIRDNFDNNFRRRFIYLRDYLGITPFSYFLHLARTEPERALWLAINLDKSIRNQVLVNGLANLSLDSIVKNSSLYYEGDIPDPESQDLDIEGYSLPQPKLIQWVTESGNIRTLLKSRASGNWKYTLGRLGNEYDDEELDEFKSGLDDLLEFIKAKDERGRTLREKFWDDHVQTMEIEGWRGTDHQLDFLLRKLFVYPNRGAVTLISDKD